MNGRPRMGTSLLATSVLAMAMAARVNVYLGTEQPWHTIKTDRARAGTVLYVALRCVDNLKIMLTPFLPFSMQRLHELLGFDDVLAPMPAVMEREEAARGSGCQRSWAG